MVRIFIKYVFWIACIYGLYKGAQFYSAYKVIGYAQECDVQMNLCTLKFRATTSDEVVKVMNDTYQCIADKQSWIEKQVFRAPSKLTSLKNDDAFRKVYKQKLGELKC